MPKTALVVSGGGSKGAFAVGALKYLVQQAGLGFDLYAGTSTGSLVVTMGALGELALLEQEYTTVRTKDILGDATLDQLDQGGFYYTTVPLRNRIQTQITPARYARFGTLSSQLFVTTVSLEQGQPVYFQLAGPNGVAPAAGGSVVPVRNREMAVWAVLASCSEPILMPTVPISVPNAGDPAQTFTDGGVLEYSPLQIALANGATDIYLVVHTPLPPNRKPVPMAKVKGLTGIAGRTISLLCSEVGDNDLRLASLLGGASRYLAHCRARAAARGVSAVDIAAIFAPQNPDADDRAWSNLDPVNLWVIDPLDPFENEGLEFDPQWMKQWLARGFQRAGEVVGAAAPMVFPRMVV